MAATLEGTARTGPGRTIHATLMHLVLCLVSSLQYSSFRRGREHTSWL